MSFQQERSSRSSIPNDPTQTSDSDLTQPTIRSIFRVITEHTPSSSSSAGVAAGSGTTLNTESPPFRQCGTKRSRETSSSSELVANSREDGDDRPRRRDDQDVIMRETCTSTTDAHSSAGSSISNNAPASSFSGRPLKQARLSITSSSYLVPDRAGGPTTKGSSSDAIDDAKPAHVTGFTLQRSTSSQCCSSSRRSSSTSPDPGPSNKKQKCLLPHKGKFILLDRHEEIRDVRAGANVTDVLDGMERELTCMMCAEIFVDPVTINPCGHAFCGSCVVKWLKSHKLNASLSYSNPTPMLTAALSKIRSRERESAMYAENYAYAGAGGSSRRNRTASAGAAVLGVAAAPTSVNGSKEEDDYYALDGRERGRAPAQAGNTRSRATSLESTASSSSDRSEAPPSTTAVQRPTQVTHPAGHKCPFCKFQPVLDANPSHSLGSLVEVYTTSRPDAKRIEEEVRQARALYQKGDKFSFPTIKQSKHEVDPYGYGSSSTSRTTANRERDSALLEARARERELAQYYKPCPSCKPLTPAELSLPEAERRYVCPVAVPDPADPNRRHDRMLASEMLPDGHVMCSACSAICAEGIAVACGLCGESACGTKPSCQDVIQKLVDGRCRLHEEHNYLNYMYDQEHLRYRHFASYTPMFQSNIVELSYFLTFLQLARNGEDARLTAELVAEDRERDLLHMREISGGAFASGRSDASMVEYSAPVATGGDTGAPAEATEEAAAAVPAAAPRPPLQVWTSSKIVTEIGKWLVSEDGVAAGGLDGLCRRADASGLGTQLRRSGVSAKDLRICRDCAVDVLAVGIFEWWMRLAESEAVEPHLPSMFKDRVECKHGRHCPHQSSWSHCKQYSHLCEKLSPEAFEHAEQPAPAEEAEVAATTPQQRFDEAHAAARIEFGMDPSPPPALDPEGDSDSEDDEEDEHMDGEDSAPPSLAGSPEDDVYGTADEVPAEIPLDVLAALGDPNLPTGPISQNVHSPETVLAKTGPRFISVSTQTDERAVQEDSVPDAANSSVGDSVMAEASNGETELEEDEVDANLPVEHVDGATLGRGAEGASATRTDVLPGDGNTTTTTDADAASGAHIVPVARRMTYWNDDVAMESIESEQTHASEQAHESSMIIQVANAWTVILDAERQGTVVMP